MPYQPLRFSDGRAPVEGPYLLTIDRLKESNRPAVAVARGNPHIGPFRLRRGRERVGPTTGEHAEHDDDNRLCPDEPSDALDFAESVSERKTRIGREANVSAHAGAGSATAVMDEVGMVRSIHGQGRRVLLRSETAGNPEAVGRRLESVYRSGPGG
jgi:hypothetical protein